ncbi:MAG: hypothetical protein J6L83_03355 [Clostridia bacterium]|nr:hypothetical protein [Clostridia bacterium]
MKNITKLLALLLAFLMLLTSCDLAGSQETESSTETVTEAPSQLESKSETETEAEPEEERYRDTISRTRKEVESMITLKDGEFEKAEAKLKELESLAIVSTDYEAVDALYAEFEDMFYYLDTQISLANIVYDLNHKNTEASSRYLDNYELFGDLYNEYMFTCRNVYEKSPIRDELFADWTEEEIKMLLNYTPESQELREANEALLIEFNELSGASNNEKKAEIYVQIIKNNNRIAELAGYDNYYDYATVEIYGRDYSVEEVNAFKSYIVKYLVSHFGTFNNNWSTYYGSLNSYGQTYMRKFLYEPFDSLDVNYFDGYVNSYDNSTGEGFRDLLENRNLIFSMSPNSHQSAYQTYLEDYETPFCLFGSSGQSTSTIVHEMGHYYASLYVPHVASYDVAEIQSQANEFLLLKYLDGKMDADIYEALEAYNVYNAVAMIIVCAAIDEFEQKVYSIENIDGYTLDQFNSIMSEVCDPYGGVNFFRNNITDINEYWLEVCPNSPVYYISYATSSIAALNIYTMAKSDEAGARETYRKLIEEIEENDGFKTVLGKIGLSSPFEEESMKKLSEDLLK